jgi:cytochrome c oxidase cbb3-type subunit III
MIGRGIVSVRHPFVSAMLAGVFLVLAEVAISQEVQTGDQNGVRQAVPYQNMTPEQRAAATRAFLGLGAEPDKAAAERGEHLLPFLKKGLPEKGMPAFATMSDGELKDIAEFVHLQVEEVANRGTYQVLNILVGSSTKGQAYVADHCMSCHSSDTFAHIGSKFRSPEQLQRGWIWPTRTNNSGDNSLAATAAVKMPGGQIKTGRVTQVSDFRITFVDRAGQTHVIDRKPGVEVEIKDPLAAHQDMIMTLTNDDMHNVTAYLQTLK